MMIASDAVLRDRFLGCILGLLAGYFEKVVALSSKADTTRPEMAHARSFLGRR
jgi:hypothetical protein